MRNQRVRLLLLIGIRKKNSITVELKVDNETKQSKNITVKSTYLYSNPEYVPLNRIILNGGGIGLFN